MKQEVSCEEEISKLQIGPLAFLSAVVPKSVHTCKLLIVNIR